MVVVDTVWRIIGIHGNNGEQAIKGVQDNAPVANGHECGTVLYGSLPITLIVQTTARVRPHGIRIQLLFLATGPVLWSVAAGAGRIVGNDGILVALLKQEHGRSGQPGNVEWMERNQASVDGKF